MATVNFSVPEDVKDAFNKAFKGENKSAILTRLMRDAIEERKRQKRRATAINEILSLRSKSNNVLERPSTCTPKKRALQDDGLRQYRTVLFRVWDQ